MHDPALVRVPQRVAECHADHGDVPVRERPRRGQLVERSAFHELGNEVVGLLVRAGLVQRHDARVAEARRRERLARGPLVVAGGGPRDDLDRHEALEGLVAREPHRAEAAGPQAAHQDVAPQDAALGGAGARPRRVAGPLGPWLRGQGKGVGGAHRCKISVLEEGSLPSAANPYEAFTCPRWAY
ncbi:MAG: hypothetical protein U0R70_09495 [Solirubrobacteraceae bacterium]